MKERVVIRHLESLVDEVRGELRLVLFALREFENGTLTAKLGPGRDAEHLLAVVEMKVRNALELLTGSRD